jgi:NitT/TauT family transport system ATP-binding protein
MQQRDTPGPPTAKLVVEGVTKWYRTGAVTVHALDDISLEIAANEFVCLVGPSGCGKSTLLDIMAGLTKADAGRVIADGEPVEGPGRQRLVMFQEPALFPWLTVYGNVMFGLKLKKDLSRRRRREIAREYLALVGLERFARSSIHELSGGMKQRAALARALAPDPKLLFMDEPFAALDAMTRDYLYGDIQRICQERGKTVVFVTHDVREACCLGDRVLLMSPRPGRIGSEFKISLPRPREINSPALAELAAQTAAALRDAGQNSDPR